jgi:peptide/nickel transport system substrate-binding protein
MTRLVSRTRNRSRQDGFTLIELLVVIVILGILAGVVVFSVSGIDDKGESAAEATDARTIRTAQEAFFAKNGRYAGSVEELVEGGFLASPSDYHHIAPTSDGTGYSIAAGQPVGDADQTMTVGYKADPWANSKLRLSRFALDAGTCETLAKVRNDYSVGERLATSWELINPGNNPTYKTGGVNNPTWRFRLRPGVTFHDGSAFTAQDVKWSMDRLVSKGDDFTAKLGAASSVVVDPQTIDITPAESNLRLPEILVHPTYAVIKDQTEPSTMPATASTVVCTGPFKFKSYTQGDRIVVERHDAYWGTKARLRELTFRFIGDATTRRLALEAGQIDAMYDVGRSQVAGLRAKSDLDVVTAPPSYVFNFYMNLAGTDPAYDELQSPSVRRALALSIDRQEFVDQNWEPGVATVVHTPSPPSILGSHAPMIQGVPFDLAQARQVLDADGWTCGGGAPGANTACGADEVRQKAGERLSLYMLSSTNNADDPLLQDLRSRALKAGIEIEIGGNLSSAQRTTRKNQGLWDLDHTNPNQNDANPAFLLTLQWWSKSVNPWVSCLAATPPNCGPWQQAGPAFDALVERALASPTFDGAQRYAAEAMDLLFDQEVKIIPLAGLSRVYAMKKGVAGFTPPHPAESHLNWSTVYRTTASSDL